MLDMEMLMKFAPASVATALASMVLPVPGGPKRSIPLQGCTCNNLGEKCFQTWNEHYLNIKAKYSCKCFKQLHDEPSQISNMFLQTTPVYKGLPQTVIALLKVKKNNVTKVTLKLRKRFWPGP